VGERGGHRTDGPSRAAAAVAATFCDVGTSGRAAKGAVRREDSRSDASRLGRDPVRSGEPVQKGKKRKAGLDSDAGQGQERQIRCRQERTAGNPAASGTSPGH
jgi:hypothetical protein